jgi:hypothetical protein
MKPILNFLKLFRRERRPGDLVFACGFLFVALCLAVSLPWQARFLGNKTFVSEPGFWPLIGVSLMVFFGLIHFISTWNAPRLSGRGREVLTWVKSAEYVVWFIAFVMVVPVVGYLPSALVFALLLCLRLGYRSAITLGAALIFAFVVVVVFKAGLGVKIPAGAAYEYLPDSIRTFFMVNF